VRLPSTTLAQDDAGVGVKNGINAAGMKNFAGAFAPPFAVINDASFLRTLPPALVLDGIAEAFKVAIIKDAAFFGRLEARAEGLDGSDWAAVEEAVQRCAMLHLDHIRTGGDPFETGSARPLDFGHWVAHRLEALSAYGLRHGQAVSIGIAVDSVYAWRKRYISRRELERILRAFRRANLPTRHELLRAREADGRLSILAGLDHFREHLGGELTITLPRGLGNRIEVHEMDHEAIEWALDYLMGVE
jgi:3-dehydroquinate synthase